MTWNLRDPDLLREACLIAGRWVGQGAIPVRDPATGGVLAHVPDCDGERVDAAIVAAADALPAWRARTAADRARILRHWFDLVTAAREDLALILTSEQGKPLAEARGEIGYAAAYIEWFAEEARRLYGEVIPSPRADARIIVLRQPVGVVAAITPWNFPAAMVTRKVAPALAAGCTLVLKPASQTPLTALALAVLAERAGLPAGVLNVVTGAARVVGATLTASPLVRKLSFTGSTAVGKHLMAQCAPTMKRLSMELGGNAPFIVFDDADIDAAVSGAIASKYRNSGQTCVCVNRFLVQRGIADRFAEKLAAAASALAVGDGRRDGTAQGPLIDQTAVAKVEEHIADALARGATLLTGGRRHALGGGFFEPTVLSGCTPDMLVASEETFGPLAALFAFDTEDEAIRLANDTEVGLAGYFYTRDHARIWRVAEALEVGMVGINSGMISTEVAPFGGIKQSGMGREGSRHGIEDYTELKYLCVAGL
ncbi:NAD-dependent succinate-semialdehyde dehydrogenase [Nitrospirillum iridis]|uniref:Succinate-semialdehyde dehydrogenase/glutarate-semialdehyde dehydrogenase n=1 Tax=Nitrospirillum iridis TaxID=765888 RepID=A0A7X0EDY8_9PROT|nr:NAD-dependent succinate-semialdehyde dehydrogenase [Nitrospirillum iridis]MBB6253288.1 succinate-semialdehyde dehydrogenase/glutarate-semialdehyde dehydrogenase [Nitrospirillum iridis]